MPELPEVEVVAQQLRRVLRGRMIVSTRVTRAKLISEITPLEFERLTSGRRVESVGRRGKIILVNIEGGITWATHLRMSGTFLLQRPNEALPKFAHAVFALDNKKLLVFEDVRHFGWMTAVPTSEIQRLPAIQKLGPEPIGAELTEEYLREAARKRRRAVKEFLLDQTVVAGLGNIYASESLHIAGINPRTCAHRLSKTKIQRLRDSIVSVIEKAHARLSDAASGPGRFDGSSKRSESERRVVQSRPRYYFEVAPDEFLVYDREDEPCYSCGSPIRRIIQGQRSTYYCPVCQG